MTTENKTRSIKDILHDPVAGHDAMREGFAEVVRIHRSLNLPLASWEKGRNGEEGKVIWVYPDELDLEDLSKT